jgi:glycerol uptake facilitator-like aquaporin
MTSTAGRRLLAEFTGTGLAVLILIFAPAGGAHFNPVVTAADWVLGRRYSLAEAGAVIGCQVAGAIGGAALADTMFAVPVLEVSRHRRDGMPLLVSEVVATAGLLLLITTLARTGRTRRAPWSVGAWIGAAYWFTASTSFANPAVTVGRMLTSTYAGIAPASAPAFIAAQIAGAAIGTALAVVLYPASASASAPQGDRGVQLTG